MAGVHGADLPDELARVDDPGYLAEPLDRLLTHFQAERDAPLLDFGCGLGASTIVLARQGFTDILATDIHPQWMQIAARRVAEEGLAARARFAAIPTQPPYDLPDAHFGTIVLNAVLEHIPPSLRAPVLAELWKKLAPGGRLLLRETPNALWPMDSHFTGLPLLFYLPLRLRAVYARTCSKRCRRDEPLESLISRGLAPPSFFALRRMLAGAECLNLTLGGDAGFYFAGAAGLRRAVAALFGAAEPLCRALGIAAAAFFPYLALGFRRPPTLGGKP